jgi:hypothetical protein
MFRWHNHWRAHHSSQQYLNDNRPSRQLAAR